jgi:DNA-binding response OmpR family regulator
MSATQAKVPNVLLIDDDANLASMLSDTLGAGKYRIWHVRTAREAEAVLDQAQPDLILLDLMLPDQNGLILCASLRDQVGVPVIICTASRRKDDAALGLKLGATDFVSKPFSVDELRARMDAALQQPGSRTGALLPSANPVQQISGLVIERARCRATMGGELLDLTPTEYRLLCAIASRPHQVLSREELADGIWGAHDTGIIRSLDVHMRRLRAKLRAAGPVPWVTTHRGLGYELVGDTPGG